jgi:hypothetical protein
MEHAVAAEALTMTRFAFRLGSLVAAAGISIGIWLVMASLVRAWWSLGSPGLRVVALALAGFAGSFACMSVLCWRAGVTGFRRWRVRQECDRAAREWELRDAANNW